VARGSPGRRSASSSSFTAQKISLPLRGRLSSALVGSSRLTFDADAAWYSDRAAPRRQLQAALRIARGEDHRL